MKKFTFLSFLGLSVLLINSCKKEMIGDQLNSKLELRQASKSPFLWTTYGGKGDVCGEATKVTLYAGQNINVGCVKVWNDKNNLYVKYETKYPWKINEIHLYVGECDKIPQNNGNPTPGQFPIKNSYSNGTDCATFCIPLSCLPECVCIAAHAVVTNSCTYQQETAWGDGCDFSGKNWATYFKFCEQKCCY